MQSSAPNPSAQNTSSAASVHNDSPGGYSLKPTILFIFGGSGDLAQRKLIPALFNLYLDNWLPKDFAIVGIGRHTFTAEEYAAHLLKGAEQHSRRKEELKTRWAEFIAKVSYQEMDLMQEGAYSSIADTLNIFRSQHGADSTVVYYLSVAPQLAPTIAQKLHGSGLCMDKSTSRLVFEKPFGHDLKSATELNNLLRSMYAEEQIYRIDHYLGKETVQNILALRFANALFEPVWNSNYIDHIQITAAESVTVEGRGGYYEGSGALRDMIQNHLLQMLCMVAMEAPVSFAADEIRNKKVDVLRAIRKLEPAQIHQVAVRGQYGAGWIKDREVPGYRQEKDVAPTSGTETFAALKLYVDNWRWNGVPFYLRTGKALSKKETTINIQFKEAPLFAFPKEAGQMGRPNRLVINVQPQMNVRLRFQAKTPGPHMTLQPVDMTFNYGAEKDQPEAYETLLEDVMEGNQTLFMRGDQVEAAWNVIKPVMDAWQAKPPVDFPNYAAGSFGPEDAEALIARDGRTWKGSSS